MGSIDDFSDLCRLCLVKDQVNIPIFDETSDIGQTFLKIESCLPVKVSRDDNLPKKICDGCSYKLDMLYIFRNTSIDSEKQLISWLSQAGLSTTSKDPLATTTKPEIMVKQEAFEPSDTRVDGDSSDLGVDAHSYMMQQQQLPYQQDFDFGEPSSSAARLSDEPSPKRAKRAAALKKAPIEETEEDEEEDLDAAMQITKAEDEDSEDADQPDYVEAPSTSADDQPGPSGVGKGAVEAPYPPDVIKTEQLDIHISDQKKYACNICKLPFDTYDQLKNHRRKYHKIKDHRCTLCNKSFRDNFQLKIHSFSHTKEKPHECDLCCARFKLKSKLNQHRKYHENTEEQYVCPICGKTYNNLGKGALISHLRAHNDPGITCEVCGKFLSRQGDYKRHKMNHESTTEYPCSLCDKVYRHKRSYDRHVERHNGMKFLCSVCGKEVASTTTLRIHMRKHTGEKPFECTYCEKKFTSKTCLKEHVRTHTNERPFACELCGKRFTQRGPLKLHKKALHTRERPFSCDICSKKFVTRTVLNTHLKAHSNKAE